MHAERVIARKDGAIGWITLDHQERFNAMSLDMWQALPPLIAQWSQDADIRVIVLEGAGDKAFVSGADISEFETLRATPEDVARYEDDVDAAMAAVAGCDKPVIAMINGICMGGGVGLAVSCDMRIASDHARFAVPAARLGLGYRHSGVRSLVNLVGAAAAKEIFFTARQLSSDEAAQIGLVNRVVPRDELRDVTRDYCTMIAENAPLTIMAVKQTIAEIQQAPGEFNAARCDSLVFDCFASEDYREGRRAFMEKRKPEFKGQ